MKFISYCISFDPLDSETQICLLFMRQEKKKEKKLMSFFVHYIRTCKFYKKILMKNFLRLKSN